MFCNLGMAADAAAAHGHEFSSPKVLDNPARLRMPPNVPRNSLPPAPSKPTKSVLFEDAENDGFDYDGFPQTSAIASRSVGSGSRPTKCTQTSFQLAHPAPLSKHKILRLHTPLLLQLQQISEGSRPTPALDVLPSAIFAPRPARRCSRVFNGRNGLGHNDLVIVGSQTYEGFSELEAAGTGHGEDGDCDDREVVAAICPLKKAEGGDQGKAEIRLNYGPSWLASPLINGVYEFVSTDESGVTRVARWVPRYRKGRRRATVGHDSSGYSSNNEKKFGFSIVNPECRRHAVIATLNRHSINIRDQYPVQSSVPINLQLSPSPDADPVATEHSKPGLPFSSNKILVDTDEHLRTLIVISGIWVAFREGYSQNFKYRDPFSSPRGSSDIDSINKHWVSPMTLYDTGSHRVDVLDSKEDQSNTKGWRTSPKSLHHTTASTTPWLAFSPKSSPRRANSTGTTFLQRASRHDGNAARPPHPSLLIYPGEKSTEQPPRSRRLCACVTSSQPWQTSKSRKRQRRSDSWPSSSTSAPHRNCAKDDGKESESDQDAAGGKAHHTPENGRAKKAGILKHLFCFIKRVSGIS
ncbi:MAG: hypothetical protein FRX48_05084 [Lasallia pustulata]|uniref:Uncharacterized protein n=1 Tax=Lasallia pustulata TaxID=136370 RepID=A0A5M8PPC0_9LECA|nr:MAG: hypothetical protein FRX48_05084 [Lasallia pustulata]